MQIYKRERSKDLLIINNLRNKRCGRRKKNLKPRAWFVRQKNNNKREKKNEEDLAVVVDLLESIFHDFGAEFNEIFFNINNSRYKLVTLSLC